MKKIFIFMIFLILSAWSLPVFAVPVLQLDIGGGYYDPVSETIIAPGQDFTLYALAGLSRKLKKQVS